MKLNLHLTTELNNDSFSLSKNVALDKSSMTFAVGTEQADIISSHFIKTSYPVINQRNYMIEEYDEGIIQLFEPLEESKVYLSEQNDYLFIIKTRTDSLVTKANYDAVQRQFTYQMPSGLLNSTSYNFSIYSETHAGTLFSDNFRTSKFSTFKEKMSNLTRTNAGWYYPTDNGREFGYTIFPSEAFDDAERNTILKLRGNLEETRWYVENIEEIIYRDYNDLPFEITWREPEILGVPPSRAFNIRADNSGSIVAFICEYDIVMRADYDDLRKKADRYEGENNEAVDKLLQSEYKSLNSNIVLNLDYTIPGLDVVSSTYRIEYLLENLLNRVENNSPNLHRDMLR